MLFYFCYNVNSSYKKDVCFSNFELFMLYENFYCLIFTCHSADKIWLPICTQGNIKPGLHY